ncbi:hypothetical protein, partial [Novipirellula rosea]|uniref:hypothetical protein n=1 Tax=Novipirellula rosea TaxID=1031540 RepID=UPI0031E54B5A
SVLQPDSESIQRLRERVKGFRSRIEFNRRDPGETETERQQTYQLIRELRHSHNEALAELSEHESAKNQQIVVPVDQEVVTMLEKLRTQLLDAHDAQDDQQLRLARRLIEALMSGTILLYQQGERRQGHGWLQGRAQVNVVAALVKRFTGISIDVSPDDQIELKLDYKRPLLIDEQSETAKRLWDQGLLQVEIARQMGCIPPYVTKLIQHWHDKRRLPRPNNKSR